MEGGEGNFRDIMRAAKTGHMALCKWDGWEYVICPAFSAGECSFARCKAAHLFGGETPSGYVARYCTIIKPGVKKVLVGDYEPRRTTKRQKNQG